MYKIFSQSLIAVFMLALCTASVADPKVTVTVRQSPVVSGSQTTISDLADVDCSDEILAQRIGETTLCPAPLPGKTRTFTRSQIASALRRQGLKDGSFDLRCPSQVTATRESTTVSGQNIVDAVRDFVINTAAWPGTVTVEPSGSLTDQVVQAGTPELQVRMNGASLRKGRNTLPVDILVDGTKCATVNVSVMIKVFAPVLVASGPIRRTDEITSSNTRLVDMDITNLPDDVLTELPVDEMTAAVSISSGAAIRNAWVTLPPVVKSGDRVTVAAGKSRVRVTAKGIAAADGRIGDRIRIRMSGGDVYGVVTGPGRAEISSDRRASR